MENFRIAVNAVMPFMICIAFGYAVRRLRLADRAFMQSLNQLVFKVFFPFMMFYNMYDNGDSLEMNARLLAVSVCSLFLLIAVLFMIVPLLVRDNPKRGVVIQGIYRSNFVLFAIPLTENLFGREGIAMASLLVAVIVPLYNVTAVIILEYFRGGRISIVTLAGKILKNPLILGALAGLIALVCGICLPQAVEKISWSMPTYWKKRSLIHFAAFKKHIGLYPGPEAIEAFADRLSAYKTSKGAIQLPYNQPLPDELIADLAKWCEKRQGS